MAHSYVLTVLYLVVYCRYHHNEERKLKYLLHQPITNCYFKKNMGHLVEQAEVKYVTEFQFCFIHLHSYFNKRVVSVTHVPVLQIHTSSLTPKPTSMVSIFILVVVLEVRNGEKGEEVLVRGEYVGGSAVGLRTLPVNPSTSQ